MEKYAIDCETIGNYNYKIRLLARVTIVNQNGEVIFDEYIRPKLENTDFNYRNLVSGIKREKLRNGLNKSVVRDRVTDVLNGNILIGHSLQFRLDALELNHPEENRRDLAKYPPLMCDGHPVNLQGLAGIHLNRYTQQEQYDTVENARKCMNLYLKFAQEWEENYSTVKNQ